MTQEAATETTGRVASPEFIRDALMRMRTRQRVADLRMLTRQHMVERMTFREGT
jgi:hypothetical protein